MTHKKGNVTENIKEELIKLENSIQNKSNEIIKKAKKIKVYENTMDIWDYFCDLDSEIANLRDDIVIIDTFREMLEEQNE